jgi:HlyD family secretion protein
MKKKTIIITAVAVVAVAAIAVAVVKARGEKPLEVQTTEAKRQEVIHKVNATGKVQPKTQVKISADVSARIMRLGVEEGDRVERGQFLVELDREAYLAQVESVQANVRSAEALAKQARETMLQAEREFKRAAEIVRLKLDSQARLDEAEAAYKVEVARYESAIADAARARATLKQAKDSLNKTSIYAPMAGVITELRREQGEIAIGSQFQEDVILVISDMSEMEVQLDVDENDIVSVALGDVAEIEVDALSDRKLAGTVYEIANSAKSSNGQAQAQSQNQKTEFVVKVAITEPPPELRPGMTAAADIVTDTKEAALSVPVQCVTVRTLEQLEGKDGDKQKEGSGGVQDAKAEDGEPAFKADEDGFVQVVFVLEDGKAVARQVETGIQGENLLEITSGLAEGETIISGGYRAISRDLKNGAKVEVNNDVQEKAGQS